jgi:hypothetical protein
MRKSSVLFIILLIPFGCAFPPEVVQEDVHTVYVAPQEEDSRLSLFAPVFLTYNHRDPYNRIGRPSAKYDEQGNERIYVDHEKPAIYYMTKSFSTERGVYTNLIYRVHFPRVPCSLIPFHLNAGRNVGVLTVITIDEEERPLLVTTVGTCGCYVAIVPTSYLPSDALPDGWTDEPLKVYGERLPAVLDYRNLKDPKVVIYLRSGVHRVMDLDLIEAKGLWNSARFTIIEAPMVPMDTLERISINGETTSFYYKHWPLRGHVKGSVKPWETLFLGLISLDFFVGADKVYGDSSLTGNPFYTSLKPWNRDSSDMWDFPGFLRFWGWEL